MASEELQAATGQVVAVAQAGLPLAPGLRSLAEEVPWGRIRRALRVLSYRLDAGESLESVLSQSQRLVPPALKALLVAAISSASLGVLLDRYLMVTRVQRDLRRRLLLAIAYPAVLVAAALGVVTFSLVWTIPEFGDIFEGFDVELPAITVVLLKSSDIVVEYGGFIAMGLAVLLALAFVGIPLLVGQAAVRRVLFLIPIVGSMLQCAGLAAFCHLLALLLDSRVRLADALRLSGDACGDASLKEHASALARGVEDGFSLVDATFGLSQFPPLLLHVFRWQSRGDAFADILQANAEVFESRARTNSGMLAGIIEPFVLVGVAAIVGGIVIALFMPLIKLLNELS